MMRLKGWKLANSLKPIEGEVLQTDERVKFTQDTPQQVKELCLLGLTNEQVACAIDISLRQLKTWRKEYPEIAEAMLEGRERADAKVAGKLYQRALGITVTEVKTQGSVVTTTTKELPPDVGAASLILRNHQSGKFKDTKEITGKITFTQMLDELESGGG